jgi:hypothetical protein
MYKVSFTDRLRYAFDNTMARGPIALIGWLGLLSGLVILTIATFVAAAGIAPPDSEQLGFIEATWVSLMHALDSGAVGGDNGWSFRIPMLLMTFGGIFLVSTLIGVLTSGIEGKLEDLRKGRSRVIERDHIVILGWSQQIFAVISELIAASTNKPWVITIRSRWRSRSVICSGRPVRLGSSAGAAARST